MTKKVAIPPMISDIVASGITDLDGFLFDAADRCPYCGGELRSHDIKHKVFARIDTEIMNAGMMNPDQLLFAGLTASKNAGGENRGDGRSVNAGKGGSTGSGGAAADGDYGGDENGDSDRGDGDNGHGRNITVNVRRWRCTACGKLVYSKSPFYDGIRMGAPIADFCAVNRDLHPPNHIAKILGKLGITVTPATVRNILKSDIPELSNPEKIPSVNIYGIIFPSSLLNISERIRRGR